MHTGLGSATLSQLAFPREGNPNFPWEKSPWDNTVVKKKLDAARARIQAKKSGQVADKEFTLCTAPQNQPHQSGKNDCGAAVAAHKLQMMKMAKMATVWGQ